MARVRKEWLSVENAEALYAFLSDWLAINQVVEVRYLPPANGASQPVKSLYLALEERLTPSSLHRLVNEVDGVNLYISTQRVHEGCICRAPLRWVTGGKGVGAADIVRLTHLVLDFDPIRPSGVPASESERARALEASDWLTQAITRKFGYEPRLVLDTGNGVQALYALDEAPTTETQQRIKAALDYLGEVLTRRYPDVMLDPAASNMAQLTRLPYSTNAKGYAWKDRVHRVVQVRQFHPNATPITLDPWVRTPTSPNHAPTNEQPERGAVRAKRYTVQEVEVALHNAGCPTRPHRRARNGSTIIPLEHCPFNPDHKNGHNNPAVFVSQDGHVGFKCFHTDCAHYTGRDLRRKLNI